MRLLGLLLPAAAAAPTWVVGELWEDATLACARQALVPAAVAPWDADAAASAAAELGRAFAGVGGCCEPGLWCDADECATHAYGEAFSNAGAFSAAGPAPAFPCEPPGNDTVVPVVTELSASSAAAGDTLTIFGADFGDDAALVEAVVGGAACAPGRFCHVNCAACDEDADCADGAACINIVTRGRFCLYSCADEDCPCGNACRTLSSTSGASYRYCLNAGVEVVADVCADDPTADFPASADAGLECVLQSACTMGSAELQLAVGGAGAVAAPALAVTAGSGGDEAPCARTLDDVCAADALDDDGCCALAASDVCETQPEAALDLGWAAPAAVVATAPLVGGGGLPPGVPVNETGSVSVSVSGLVVDGVQYVWADGATAVAFNATTGEASWDSGEAALVTPDFVAVQDGPVTCRAAGAQTLCAQPACGDAGTEVAVAGASALLPCAAAVALAGLNVTVECSFGSAVVAGTLDAEADTVTCVAPPSTEGETVPLGLLWGGAALDGLYALADGVSMEPMFWYGANCSCSLVSGAAGACSAECGVCATADPLDCAGVCLGAAELDSCGVCDGFDAALDCAGECFGAAEEDCAGTCSGTAEVDACGVCGGLNATLDCAGECGGGAEVDDCGVCGGGDADKDCDGVCFGPNPPDCRGTCGGSGVLDYCGVCDGGNATLDCAGECGGGAEVDDCGVCGGGDGDKDCEGVCFGSKVWIDYQCKDPDDDGPALSLEEAIGLFSLLLVPVALWYCCCRRVRSPEEMREVELRSRPGGVHLLGDLWDLGEGLPPPFISHLPVARCDAAARELLPDPQCSICISEYEDGELLRVLPCEHAFHAECVDSWLARSVMCPLCKGDVRPGLFVRIGSTVSDTLTEAEVEQLPVRETQVAPLPVGVLLPSRSVVVSVEDPVVGSPGASGGAEGDSGGDSGASGGAEGDSGDSGDSGGEEGGGFVDAHNSDSSSDESDGFVTGDDDSDG